jgi:hypothetical protein
MVVAVTRPATMDYQIRLMKFDQLGKDEAMAIAEGTTIAVAMYCHP